MLFKFKKFWKQFWCNHFWRQVGALDLLRKESLHNWDTNEWRYYNIFAVNYTCIKCNKHKLVEQKQIRIQT